MIAIPRSRTPRTVAAPRPVGSLRPALLAVAEQALEDGMAEDVTVIDLDGKSNIADHMIIATGRSARQVAALATRLLDGLKAAGYGGAVEGLPLGDWVLVDAGDLLVHLFRPEVRAYYHLEKMWGATLAEPMGLAQ